VPGRVNGFSLGYTAVGGVVLWSGIKGWSISATFRNLLSGTTPTSSTEPINTTSVEQSAASSSSGSYAATGSGSGSGQAALKQAAARYGWDTGNQWTALNAVEMAEAGYSATAKNPSSGALGLAQALGHGNANTAGTLGNEYGGYGLTDSEAKQANSGNAYYQAVWMTNYIKTTYGNPVAAWAHEQSHRWY